MTTVLIAEIAHLQEQLRQAKADRDTFRELADRLGEVVKELRAERDRMRKQLNSILAMTGQVVHTNFEECAGCGCMSLTAEEAVAYLAAERDVALEEVFKLQSQIAGHCERIAVQSELLARRAEAPVDGWG